jgi:hypothetical protein
MMQQEIQFFYPLTDQILLDLNFQPCKEFQKSKEKEGVFISSGTITFDGIGAAGINTTGTYITNGTLTINCDEVKFQSKKKHTFIQKIMHKAIGIKVEKI